ncbi:MAG TPA: helix-turn-helix transcriptional regulator [Longimicrobiales bacterium]|nr:helix-turn-helix transcriptional regulator [Longimicrobiales bacterium]
MTSKDQSADAGQLLPLKPAWLYILLALRQGAQHGYAIRAHAEEASQGAVRLWPATLYGSIRELSDAGAIEELEGEEDLDGDQRRRYYRLTRLGREVLRAEADRLQALADAAREVGVVGRA